MSVRLADVAWWRAGPRRVRFAYSKRAIWTKLAWLDQDGDGLDLECFVSYGIYLSELDDQDQLIDAYERDLPQARGATPKQVD